MIESIEKLIGRYPGLKMAENTIQKAEKIIIEAYREGKTVFTCGNGGSAADADHIVGELMKGFLKKRPLAISDREKLLGIDPENGCFMADNLQCGLPAISLHSQSALLTAFANDVDASMMYAQVVYAMGREGDVLIAMSTSGNSANVVNAAKTAKIKGMKVISLTGQKTCRLDEIADAAIHVGETETYKVQELHLPVYHRICAAVENEFFNE